MALEKQNPKMKKRPDQAFLDWVSFQPSCVSGQFSEYGEDGVGRSIACHVRRVNRGSGTGHKPLYSAVPLTKKEHDLTHQKSESALKPKEWFEEKADYYYQQWRENEQ